MAGAITPKQGQRPSLMLKQNGSMERRGCLDEFRKLPNESVISADQNIETQLFGAPFEEWPLSTKTVSHHSQRGRHGTEIAQRAEAIKLVKGLWKEVIQS